MSLHHDRPQHKQQPDKSYDIKPSPSILFFPCNPQNGTSRPLPLLSQPVVMSPRWMAKRMLLLNPSQNRGDWDPKPATQSPSTSPSLDTLSRFIPSVPRCIGLWAEARGRLHSLYRGILGCHSGSFRSWRCFNFHIGCTGRFGFPESSPSLQKGLSPWYISPISTLPNEVI